MYTEKVGLLNQLIHNIKFNQFESYPRAKTL